MTDKRNATGPLAAVKAEAKTGESLARLSDHLGRLLAHADQMLAEWQAHADGAARGAGEVLQRTLEAALADTAQLSAVQLERVFGAHATRLADDLARARQAAADLEAHMARIGGGARPTSVDELRAALAGINAQLRAFKAGGPPWTMILAASANLLVLAVLAVVLLRAPTVAAPPPAPAPVVLVAPDAPLPAPPPPRPAACSGLAVEPAEKLALACLAQLCGAPLPKANLTAGCKPAEPAARDLVAAFAVLEREKGLGKLACAAPAPDADGRLTVTVRWLLECAPGK